MSEQSTKTNFEVMIESSFSALCISVSRSIMPYLRIWKKPLYSAQELASNWKGFWEYRAQKKDEWRGSEPELKLLGSLSSLVILSYCFLSVVAILISNSNLSRSRGLTNDPVLNPVAQNTVSPAEKYNHLTPEGRKIRADNLTQDIDWRKDNLNKLQGKINRVDQDIATEAATAKEARDKILTIDRSLGVQLTGSPDDRTRFPQQCSEWESLAEELRDADTKIKSLRDDKEVFLKQQADLNKGLQEEETELQGFRTL